jgi:hypothetical protein
VKKVRVPVFGSIGKSVEIPIGAVVGQTLFLPGGSVVTEDMLFGAGDEPAQSTQLYATTWPLILDVPPNVTALAETATTGLYVITGAGTSETREIAQGSGIVVSNGTGVAGDPQISFSADTAEVAHLPGATYKTVQKLIDVMFSPGIITGGDVTELTTTSVRITAGTAVVRIADDNVSELRFFDFPSQDFSVPDVQVTHFYALDYNGGSPVIVESTVTENWDRDTEIPLGSSLRGDGILNITPNPYRVGDVITNLIQRLDAIGPVQRDNSVGGLQLGETGTRNVTVSAGRLWARVTDFIIASKNSSIDSMQSVFFNGTNLTVTSGITQWDNLRFNNLGTGLLQTLGNNKYANLWFFMSFNGDHYGFAYGTNEYNSLGDAANEGIPSYLTQNFFNQFILLGRFIFKKSDAAAAQIESAFVTPFTAQAVNTHNDLGGLQGGVAGEFYHLTNSEHTDLSALAALGTGFPTHTGADTWAARSFPNGTGFTWTNPAGIAGDPTLVLNSNLQAWSAIATDSKEPAITTGTTAQFWRGDKTFSDTLTGSLVLQSSVNPDITMQYTASPGSSQSIFGLNGGDTSSAQATINFRANEAWGVGARGTRIDFRTTPNGSTTLTMVASIQNIGIGFGTTTPNYAAFTNAVTVQGATNSALELASTRADAVGVLIGAVSGNWRTATSGHQRIAEVQFLADGTTANQRGGEVGFFTKSDASTTLSKRWSVTQAGHYLPAVDATYNIGSASLRTREYFGSIGAINTSDERQKTERGPLTSAELAAASEIARDVTAYQMNDAIAAKGDDARLHIGWMAQRVRDVMAAHGLDGFRYGFLCYDEWDEQNEVWQDFDAQEEVWEWSEEIPAVIDDETGEVTTPAVLPIKGALLREAEPARRELVQLYRPAGSLYGLRKDELMAFIIAAQEQRLQSLESLLSQIP